MVAPVYGCVLEAIGNTPLQEIKHLDTGVCRLFLKLENQNPGGSIKDRIGRSMIEAAEADGRLKPGGTIIEATAGNTGLGLALTASQKGYKLVIVVPDKMAQEKIFHLRAMGAEVIITRSDVGKGHEEYYQDLAAAIARTKGYFYVNQFTNPANPDAHEKTTGPETVQQLASVGLVPHAVVCGVGSGGTLTGLSRYFAKVMPEIEIVLADPEGSILQHYVETGDISPDVGAWMVEGIGEDFLPEVADLSRVKKAYTISDELSFATARELLRKEGLMAGSSTGTLVAAALKYAREQTEPRNIVSFVCDSGNKYLSKMFNDYWMVDNGFIERPLNGDLRDLISHKYVKGETITLKPQSRVSDAYRQMKLYDISQLPVIEDDDVVGLVDEEDLLIHVLQAGGKFDGDVANIMTRNLIKIEAQETMDGLLKVLTGGMTALIMHDGHFQGIVTKMDVLNHLRLAQRSG